MLQREINDLSSREDTQILVMKYICLSLQFLEMKAQNMYEHWYELLDSTMNPAYKGQKFVPTCLKCSSQTVLHFSSNPATSTVLFNFFCKFSMSSSSSTLVSEELRWKSCSSRQSMEILVINTSLLAVWCCEWWTTCHRIRRLLFRFSRYITTQVGIMNRTEHNDFPISLSPTTYILDYFIQFVGSIARAVGWIWWEKKAK